MSKFIFQSKLNPKDNKDYFYENFYQTKNFDKANLAYPLTSLYWLALLGGNKLAIFSSAGEIIFSGESIGNSQRGSSLGFFISIRIHAPSNWRTSARFYASRSRWKSS